MNYGRYEIMRELGKGAMGVVYQARDPQIGRIVALKILRPDRVSSESFVYRFLKEARAIGRLSHPNIVTVYDIGEDQGTVFIAMEYVEGEPLSIIAQKKRWTEDEIIGFGIDVAETLYYAHQKGIIHRDIKPSNIIVTPEGKVKITDFGIAHIEDPSLSLQTQAGEILGTPAYMSPEQVLSRPVDGRSDLFSLGIILYELASGRRPFEGDSLASVFNAVTQSTPAEPSLINAAISRPFSDVLMKCVRKEPNERFESGMAVAEALRSIKQAKLSAPSKKPGRAEKQKAVAFLVSVIIALLIGIGGLSYYLLFGLPKKTAEPDKGIEQRGVSTERKVSGIESTPESPTERKGGEAPKGPELPLPPKEKMVVSRPDPTKKRLEPPDLPRKPETKTAVLPPPEESGKMHKAPESSFPETRKIELPPVSDKKAGLPVVSSPAKPIETFLRVQSTPVGAEVFIDGASKGKTPVRLDLSAGKHEVRLALSEYFDWEAQVEVFEGRETPLVVKLLSMTENAH